MSYTVCIESSDRAQTSFIQSLLTNLTFTDDRSKADTIIFIGKFERVRRPRPQIIGININVENSIDVHKGKFDMFDHIFINSRKYLIRLQRKLGTRYVHYLPELDVLKRKGSTLEASNKIAVPDDFKHSDSNTISFSEFRKELPRCAVCYTKDQVIYCINTLTPFVYTGTRPSFVKEMLSDDFILSPDEDAISYLMTREKDLRSILTQVHSNCRQCWNTKQLVGIVQSMERRKVIIDHVDLVQIDTIHNSYIKLLDHLTNKSKLTNTSLKRLSSFISMKINCEPNNSIFMKVIKDNPKEIYNYMVEFKRQYARESISVCNRLTPVHYGKLRLGWDRIMKYLNCIMCDNGILFDPCLNDTFNAADVLEPEGIIPYTVPWIGIVHDPISINTLFIKSIVTCQALICFTDVIYDELQSDLNTLKTFKYINHSVNLIKLVHPTHLPDRLYTKSPKRILSFPNSKGENSFAFCRLRAGGMKKVLVGNKSDFDVLSIISRDEIEISKVNDTFKSGILRYIHDEDFLCKEFGMTQSDIPDKFEPDNDYVIKLKNHVESFISSCDYTKESDFKNAMVFMDFPINSGVQYPLIECIMTNIPILVKKTSTTVEYLGETYPLFFKNLNHASSLMANSNINEAHLYLKNKNKHQFMIENLVDKLTKADFYDKLFA
uniref:Uncharacterized protein n=1 Tax=Pithovirus LCPAC403 TaxID=2506596 RepID=A0A481ZB72_9VIRU|nr:MAG: hypothetical protein LCPAC403_01610 [Pithovirus LCPAC403]